jgi:hypothetical protein
MIELLLAVCLIDEPSACKDVSLTFDPESVSLLQCVMGAQPQLAEWSEAHPKWRIAHWSCGIAGKLAKA